MKKSEEGKTATIIVYEEGLFNEMFDAIFADILSLPDVYKIIEKSFPNTGIYKYLPSRIIKKYTLGYSDYLYFQHYNLAKEVRRLKKRYSKIKVLFHNAGIRKPGYPVNFLQNIKKMGVSFSLLYLDIHSRDDTCAYANYLSEQGIFDHVFTFDPQDAQKYKIQLCFTPYSKVIKDTSIASNKLYFCGGGLERFYLLYKIWESAQKHSAPLTYDLICSSSLSLFFNKDANVVMHRYYISYLQILKQTLDAGCILDIIREGQSGQTLRPYEAVVYNKKLLTNNPNIFTFPYYNPQYMHYFETPEDIDWAWVTCQETVNYDYQGDFSPVYLLEKMKD